MNQELAKAREESEESNLGNAIVNLNIEDSYLANGELNQLGLDQRVEVVNQMISRKLELGRWESVIQMVYGDLGKAGALFRDPIETLNQRIIDSAVKHHGGECLDGKVVDTLSKEQGDFLLKLASSLPSLDRGGFCETAYKMWDSYFEDTEKGGQRKKTFHEIAGQKALAEKDYFSAAKDFEAAEDRDNLGLVLETILSSENRDEYPLELIDMVGRHFPERGEELLRERILSHSTENGISAKSAYELARDCHVKLTKEQQQRLDSYLADSLSEKELKGHKYWFGCDFKLLWAKKHRKDNPRAAYRIFTDIGCSGRLEPYEGKEVLEAVVEGLRLGLEGEDRLLGALHPGSSKALYPGNIQREHLEAVYDKLPFNTRFAIAEHQDDKDKLMKLSREAEEKGNHQIAYNIWIKAEGSLDDAFFKQVRGEIIKQGLDPKETYFKGHLDSRDIAGRQEVCDAFMRRRSTENLRIAYNFAKSINDEQRTQKARQKIVARGPREAYRFFQGFSQRERDETGIDLAVAVIAKEQGVSAEQLKPLVEKYGLGYR